MAGPWWNRLQVYEPLVRPIVLTDSPHNELWTRYHLPSSPSIHSRGGSGLSADVYEVIRPDGKTVAVRVPRSETSQLEQHTKDVRFIRDLIDTHQLDQFNSAFIRVFAIHPRYMELEFVKGQDFGSWIIAKEHWTARERLSLVAQYLTPLLLTVKFMADCGWELTDNAEGNNIMHDRVHDRLVMIDIDNVREVRPDEKAGLCRRWVMLALHQVMLPESLAMKNRVRAELSGVVGGVSSLVERLWGSMFVSMLDPRESRSDAEYYQFVVRLDEALVREAGWRR